MQGFTAYQLNMVLAQGRFAWWTNTVHRTVSYRYYRIYVRCDHAPAYPDVAHGENVA
jgi:hypothetical protein